MTELPSAVAGLNKPSEWRVELCFTEPQSHEAFVDALPKALGGALAEFGSLTSSPLGARPGRSGGFIFLPQGLEPGENGAPGLSISFEEQPVAPDNQDMLQSLSQTWQWDEAEQIVPSAPGRVVLRSVNSLELPSETRIGLFQKALYALTAQMQPKALIFPQSQCCVEPSSFIENHPDNEDYFAIYGLVNTRVFTSEEDDGQSVFMDTIGMHLLGLPDVQCLVSDQETDFAELAYWMYNLVEYLRENPGTFEEGDVVVGLEDQEWEVSYSSSLIDPERSVINVNTMQLELSDLFPEDGDS